MQHINSKTTFSNEYKTGFSSWWKLKRKRYYEITIGDYIERWLFDKNINLFAK